MPWWFRKKRFDGSPIRTGLLHSKEEEEFKLAENAIIRLKNQVTLLKENLGLLKTEIARDDLSHLITTVTANIDEVLDLVENPEKNIENQLAIKSSKYVINEYVVGKDECRFDSSHVNNDEDEESLDLTFHPETPEVQEIATVIKKRILLIEDNEDLRTFYRMALLPFFEIIEAGNGVEGLHMAAEVNPDLIVSDLMMPLMDGIDLCKAIKNDINTNHIPFIILTAKDAVLSRLEGTQSGADVYLVKPASAALLHATIENIFQQRQKIKEYFSKKHYSEALTLVNSVKEQEFISRVIEIIDQNLTKMDFEVDVVCRQLNLSRSKLYQKVKSLTGQSIIEFVRSYRLKKAKEIMTHEDVSLTDVMFRVGIQTPSYFTKAFKKEFGQTPSQFLDSLKNDQ